MTKMIRQAAFGESHRDLEGNPALISFVWIWRAVAVLWVLVGIGIALSPFAAQQRQLRLLHSAFRNDDDSTDEVKIARVAEPAFHRFANSPV